MIVEKYAGIDIGSNAMRLLIMNVYKDGEEVIFNKSILVRAPVRLGADSFPLKKIESHSLEMMTHAMKSFYHLMKVYEVKAYKACATSALREADNRMEVIEHIKSKAKIEIEIIDGKKEADIIYKTQINRIIAPNKSYLFIDVGGGSTELTHYHNKKVVQAKSFKIGSVRLLEGLVEKGEWKKLKDWCEDHIVDSKKLTIVGTGGNINTLFKKSLQPYGTSLNIKYLSSIRKELDDIDIDSRIKKYGFNPDRADVIVPALQIFERIMEKISGTEIFVPKIGLADGLVQMAYDEFNQG